MERLICSECLKKFASVSTKNRHLKTMHNQQVEEKKSKHICCPLCSESGFGNYDIFENHLKYVHGVSIKKSNLNFRSMDEFEAWRAQENREVDYACHRRIKRPGGREYVYYDCNRSDSRGFNSQCTKRAMKSAGSIHISGVCPSRIFAKILENAAEHAGKLCQWNIQSSCMVMVKFVETHVGHEDELRTKRKKWKRISNNERPNANYQHKSTVKAHKKAQDMINLVQAVEFGEFKVKSSSGEKFYTIYYNELCDEDCRRVYCNECKICIHRYDCECPEYAVKTVLCKHIHAVALYERGCGESVSGKIESVSGLFSRENSNEPIHIQEPTPSRIRYQDELCQFVNEKSANNSEASKCVNFDRSREIALEEVVNYTKNLEKESFQEFMDMFRSFRNNVERKKSNEICKK